MKITANTFVNEKPEYVLKKVFGYDSFRSLQKDIITAVLNKEDTLAVMPTGGGKSICYQIPALIFEGITIVVSPLISLMQDQVLSLKESGIHSVFLNSTLTYEEYLDAVQDIKNGDVKIVYVSPEGLSKSRIRDLVSCEDVNVSMIAIDEAHCVSQWGHDFRPDYLDIYSIRHLAPNAVMLALTATATNQVRIDIAKNLHLKNPKVFIASFNRENIYLDVQQKQRYPEAQVVDFLNKHKNQSGIIYCHSRKLVDELTEILDNHNFSVRSYHAGLSDEERKENQDLFIKDEVLIMVATVAFGMGIDKPNVRFVINYDIPSSVEEYYQEIGRAGRDGLPSTALLLYKASDINKIRYFIQDSATPEKDEMLLQGMIKFATGNICRRKALLAYFGEKYVKPSDMDESSCCDICSQGGEVPLENVGIPTLKLLSCIIRTEARFGASYVVDVLLGSRNKRIIDNGHDALSTYGIGTEYNKTQWMELVDLLILEGLLKKVGEYNILNITKAGIAFIRNGGDLYLPLNLRKTSSYGSGATVVKRGDMSLLIKAEKPSKDDEEAMIIKDKLSKWRKRKADDLNIPPYMIFNDKTLLDLAAKKPQNMNDLLKVYGIGNHKAEEYGSAILRITSSSF